MGKRICRSVAYRDDSARAGNERCDDNVEEGLINFGSPG